MNQAENREKQLAIHLIEQARFSVTSWVHRGYITLEDVDAAVLAALVKSVQVEADRQGLPLERLLREIA